MKVTDRRMFTDDGELREEYRFLEQQKGAAAETPPPAEPREPAVADAGAAPQSDPGGASSADETPAAAAADAYEATPTGGQAGSPGLMDLVAMLAEPVAFLLGDAKLPDGQSAEDLPRARLQIDLLGVLQEKTRGNVSAQESALLDHLLAEFRMRYVEKSRN